MNLSTTHRLAPLRLVMMIGGVLLGVSTPFSSTAAGRGEVDWHVYGGNAAGQRFSALKQIKRSNVAKLAIAWKFESGDGALQTSPLVVGRTMYGYTPDQGVFALDAASGKFLWRFESGEIGRQPARGMSYWESGAERQLFVSNRSNLWALDPATGKAIATFGDGGKIDLRQAFSPGVSDTSAVFLTTPGVIYRDLIITGFRTSEAHPAAPGDIRAFDVRTGKLRWAFHTIPHPGEFGYETWPADAWRYSGAANNWAGMAVDEQRGIVYVPTGSAAYDFYGGDRHGDNVFANCLIALDASTGKRLWHFQLVHHDIWDRDPPSPPVLLTVRRDGRNVDAVAQATKQGFLFLFDRVTGKPLFPIEERPVAASLVPGEHSAATQPFPLRPAPYTRQTLTEEDLTTRTPAAHAEALKRFHSMNVGGQFTPWILDRETALIPGFDGGAEWGGQAVDPSGVLYINSNEVVGATAISDRRGRGLSQGEQVYQQQCEGCHGPERRGSPPAIPALVGLGTRRNREQVEAVILNGAGRMPGFPQLSPEDRSAVIEHLLGRSSNMDADLHALVGDFRLMPFIAGYGRFRDSEGYPASKPPWGTLNAIDLNTGAYRWRVPLGQYPELVAKGMAETGTENYGGPLVTAGGVLIIGATIFDRKIRAFDTRNGKLLWQFVLPNAGLASPITYMIDGRQFVLIATSGGRDPKGPKGSSYVAFALPAANRGR